MSNLQGFRQRGNKRKSMSKSSTRRGKVIDLRKWHGGLRASAQTRAVPAPRPKMPLRARRMRVRALLALVFAAAAAASVWGVSALSYSPKLAINSIAVLGVKEVPVPLVRAYVETKLYDGANPLLSRGSIFLYPRTKIEKGISEYFPRISTADVSRAGLLAQALTVTIEERYPFALWCSGAALPSASLDDCYLMDGGGFVFAPATTSPANSYLIFGGGLSASTSPIGRKFLPAHLSGVLELDKLLRQAGFAPEGAYAENEQDFSVKFKEGFVLRALFSTDANELVQNLQLALSSDSLRGKEDKLEYIDLRFGNRLYYKVNSQ